MLYNPESIDTVTLRGTNPYEVADGLVQLVGEKDSQVVTASSDSRNMPLTFYAANSMGVGIFFPDTLEEIGGESNLYEGWYYLKFPPDIALVQKTIHHRQNTDDYMIAFIREVDPIVRVDLNDKLRDLVPDWSWAARWNSVVDGLASRLKVSQTV